MSKVHAIIHSHNFSNFCSSEVKGKKYETFCPAKIFIKLNHVEVTIPIKRDINEIQWKQLP